MYRKFREDPASVDRSWHEFLAGYSPDAAGDAAAAANGHAYGNYLGCIKW